MKKILFICSVTASILTASHSAKANAISVTALSVNQAASTVTFTLAWSNNWHDATNWDAAWVFVKFRDCNLGAIPYTHGLISTIIADHTIGTFQATKAD